MTARKATRKSAPAVEPPPPAPDPAAVAKMREGWQHQRIAGKLAEITKFMRHKADAIDQLAKRLDELPPEITADTFIGWQTTTYSRVASEVLNELMYLLPNLHLESLAYDAASADAARIVPPTTTKEN